MTLREADEAAQKRLPVIYQGIEYLRISETGYRYNDKGERHGFVQLLDLQSLLIVDGAILLLGILLTVVATFFAVNKYLRMRGDQLYYI